MKSLFLGLAALALVSCGRHDAGEQAGPQFAATAPGEAKEYVFAIYPLHNPARLFEIYGPLVDYLNRHVSGASFRLEASRNYEAFEEKLSARKFDFALPNAYLTLQSLKRGYHVIAKMGDDEKFAGIILVRRDSGIKRVEDLKGKTIAYPAATALGATMMPQYFLHTHGLDVNRDIVNLYVGSQESAIMNVYLGNVAAGATWLLPWESFRKEHPEQASELEVKWRTRPLVNNAVVARDDVPAPLALQVARLLDGLHETEEGRAILARIPISRFELADERRYRIAADFLREFARTVRSPQTP